MRVWASWLRSPVVGVVHVDVDGEVGEVGGMVGVVLIFSSVS